jgi:hypothetical protein
MRDGDEIWDDLIGAGEAAVRERFGEPITRRPAGGDVWLVFDTPAGRLRMRCRVDATNAPRVASWTVTFGARHDTLAGAARAVGLWPAAAPDVAAVDVDMPLVRRPLRVTLDGGGEEGGLLSLTATVREGRFDRLSVFDEPPDWL